MQAMYDKYSHQLDYLRNNNNDLFCANILEDQAREHGLVMQMQ